MQISQNFIKCENLPLFDKILLPRNNSPNMANKISNIQKSEHLPFIKQNFGILSEREIARRLKVGKTTINRWSRESGLVPIKHTVNESFFEDLNEKSAYLLGYIYADGNIAWNTKKGYYSMTITAAEKDKEHLEKLRLLISSTKPLLYSTKTKSYRLIVNSKKLCKKLMEYGLTPKKSLTIEFPNIPSEQFKHFLRGVIDGDGCVSYNNRKRSPYFEIRIYSGSKMFCDSLVKHIKSNSNIATNVKRINRNLFQARYTCSRGKKLANFIYSNANIFLERKYLTYQNNVLEVRK